MENVKGPKTNFTCSKMCPAMTLSPRGHSIFSPECSTQTPTINPTAQGLCRLYWFFFFKLLADLET